MKTRLFRKTTVTFGKPISCDELGFDKGTVSEFRDSSEYIFGKICDMASFSCKEASNDNNG